MNFNPVLGSDDLAAYSQKTVPSEIAIEQEFVSWATRLIFIYPVWWFDRPALLKGWIDRVFTSHFAFKYTTEGSVGLLKHERALVFLTTGNSKQSYLSSHTIDAIQRPMSEGTLKFCGIKNVEVHTFYAPGRVSSEERERMLITVEERVSAAEI